LRDASTSGSKEELCDQFVVFCDAVQRLTSGSTDLTGANMAAEVGSPLRDTFHFLKYPIYGVQQHPGATAVLTAARGAFF
jgi:hypothetical protein